MKSGKPSRRHRRLQSVHGPLAQRLEHSHPTLSAQAVAKDEHQSISINYHYLARPDAATPSLPVHLICTMKSS